MYSIITSIEFLGILFIYNTIFNKKTFKNYPIIIFCSVIAGVLSYLFNELNWNIVLGSNLCIISYGILFGYINKKDKFLSVMEMIVSVSILFIVEFILGGISYVIMENNNANLRYIAIALVILLIIAIILLRKGMKQKKINIDRFINKYKIINIVLINIYLIFIIFKVLKDREVLYKGLYIEIVIILLIVIAINIYFYMYLFQIFKVKKELEIQLSYNPLVNNLIDDLRANEHEYKNHLNTIYSLVQVATLEEIKEKVKEYIGDLESNKSLEGLLQVNSIIIKAILYEKIIQADNENINFKYLVLSNFLKAGIDDSEKSIVINNLLNNSFEAVRDLKIKNVELRIEEKDNKSYIQVINNTNNINEGQLKNIFSKGYSTKGNMRGYGLYNIKKIVDKHHGNIQLSLEKEYLIITIIFNNI